MRASQLLLITRRDAPADASTVSHALLVRAGMIRSLEGGVHVHGPLMVRVLRRIEAIVRDELEALGSQEVALPILQPELLVEEPGRRHAAAAGSTLTTVDSSGATFLLGPTVDEVVVAYLRDQVRSYRQLPLRLHHLGRAVSTPDGAGSGLARGRELVLGQAYSFDLDPDAMEASFTSMAAAYERILGRCGLDTTRVDDGAAVALVALAPAGDSIVAVSTNGSAATRDLARARLTAPEAPDESAMQEVSTPGAHTMAQLAAAIPDVPVERTLKTLLYEAATDGDAVVVAAVCRGDRGVNEAKLAAAVGADELRLANDATVADVTGAEPGFAGPVGLRADVRILVDPAAAAVQGFVCGANRTDAHLRDVWWGRDADVPEVVDLDLVQAGDPAPDGGSFELARGIEVGHLDAAATRVTAPLGLRVLDGEGVERDVFMGSYRLDLTTLVTALVETRSQDDGMVWPPSVAPFGVVIVQTRPGDPVQDPLADLLYRGLRDAGCDPLWDDRTERPGVKFHDADLIGVPLRVTVGRDAHAGQVELLDRRTREAESVSAEDAIARVRDLLT